MSRLSDLEEPRQSAIIARDLVAKTPVFIQLSYKSLLRRQTPVEMYCSDPNMPTIVTRSWISVPDGENLVWEMEDNRKVTCRQKFKLGLRNILNITQPNASGMVELEKAECTSGLNSAQVLKVTTSNKHLYIIFNDSRLCKEWQEAVAHHLHKAEAPAVRKNLLGSIYDISELEKNSVRMWREMKVTFVRPDGSSAEEFLVYDTTQDDLDDSLREVLSAIADKTDAVNTEILKQYLIDVTALEELKRTKDFRGSDKALDSLSSYEDVDMIDINQRLFKLVQKSQASRDPFSQAYRLMLAQKCSQTAKLATYAVMRKAGRNSLEERKSGRVSSQVRRWESDLSANVSRVRESIIERQRENVAKEEVRPRTWFREACECRLF